jgi:aryl-alcohol dehydrogenase-like predicted oxidoreductase
LARIVRRNETTTPVGCFLSGPLFKLGLGSAQFKLDAAPGSRGRSAEAEIGDILAIAARSGLSVLDAATVSAQGENVIGECMPKPCPFRVVV